jgi:hypothetical protein
MKISGQPCLQLKSYNPTFMIDSENSELSQAPRGLMIFGPDQAALHTLHYEKNP